MNVKYCEVSEKVMLKVPYARLTSFY
jgi:hypothetical protein